MDTYFVIYLIGNNGIEDNAIHNIRMEKACMLLTEVTQNRNPFA